MLHKRGVTTDLLEETKEVRKIKVGLIVHDKPELVAEFLLQKEEKEGIFRRQYIHKYREGIHSLMYWQHFCAEGNIVVEYLLDVKIEANTSDKGCTIKLSSVDEMVRRCKGGGSC